MGDAILVGVVANGDPIKAVQGAAISTAAGLFIGGVVPMIYFICKNKSLLRLGKPEMSRKALAKACGNGSSEFFTNISGSIVRTLVFNLATVIIVPIAFFYIFGSSCEAAFYGVWYSVVFSELLATFMTFSFLKKYKKKYEYA